MLVTRGSQDWSPPLLQVISGGKDYSPVQIYVTVATFTFFKSLPRPFEENKETIGTLSNLKISQQNATFDDRSG